MDDNKTVDTTWLEEIFSGGYPDYRVRKDDFPGDNIPDFSEQVADINLTSFDTNVPLIRLATFIDEISLEDFLNWQVLARSYADSYNQLLARLEELAGDRMLDTEAVLPELVFTYIVIGLLGVTSVAIKVLSCSSAGRALNLRSNPGTIGSVSLLKQNKVKSLSVPGHCYAYTGYRA